MTTADGPHLAPARFGGAFSRTMVFLGYGLLLLALPTFGTSALLALILAYARRDGAAPLIRSHHRFQIRIFWIGLGLACAAMALGTAAVWEAARPTPAPLRVPVSPEAKLIAYVPDEPALAARPAAFQGFTYSFRSRSMEWRTRAVLEGSAAAVLFGFACLWGLGAPVYGAARLASGRAMGHDPD